mgnify:CR=1 FL=1
MRQGIGVKLSREFQDRTAILLQVVQKLGTIKEGQRQIANSFSLLLIRQRILRHNGAVNPCSRLAEAIIDLLR